MNVPRRFVVPLLLSLATLFLPLVSQGAPKKKSSPSPKYTVTGRITGLAPQHHARVTATGGNHPAHTATTHQDGVYTLRSMVAGSYTVRPSRTGYTFSPTFRTVAVTNSDRSGIDFVAHPQPVKKKR